MRTTVESDSPTKKRLVIEVEPSEIAPIYDVTMKRLAREVKVPGFRKGKVPKALIESRIGKEAIKDELLRDALPAFYEQAAAEQSLRPVTYPDLQLTTYEEGGGLTFTATVEVRPEIALPQYTAVAVDRPSDAATQEEIDTQIERLRDRFSTLEPVSRTAMSGDHATIDINSTLHDEQIEQASAQDLSYELGSGSFVPELDNELEGTRAGDILKFNATLPAQMGEPHGGSEVTMTVIVKEVQRKNPPDLDDEFAKIASEFDTLAELRADLAERISSVKKVEADIAVRNRLIEQLIDMTEVHVPESLTAHETEHRLAGLIKDLERAGLTIEAYLESSNATQEELVENYRQSAEKNLAADFFLDAVAQAEELKVAPEDIEQEVLSIAARTGTDPDKLVKELSQSGRINALAGDILRRKALEYLVENAEINEEPAQSAGS